MGMFDWVTCKYPLPLVVEDRFQSKDLECELSEYLITTDGRLVTHVLPQQPATMSIRFYQYDSVNQQMVVYEAEFPLGPLIRMTLVSPKVDEDAQS